MKIRQIREITYDINLTINEAYWLKCMVQNAFIVNNLESENSEEAEIRQSFWDALPSIEELKRDKN